MPDYDVLARQIGEAIGPENLLTDGGQLGAYAVDGVVPHMLAAPGNVSEAQAVMRAAWGQGASVIPRGSGSKMGLGSPPRTADVMLSVRRLSRVVEYDVANLTIIAETGVLVEDIQKQTAPNRQFLPLDPPFPSSATMGGVIATNSSGPRRLAYGAARDLVLGMKVIMPNGDLVHAGGKTVKNVAGYDLDKLFIGSLGTLCVVVEIAMRLLPSPEKKSSLVAAFPSLDGAAAMAGQLLKSQYLPTALEIVNSKSLELMGSGSGTWALLIPVEGAREAVDRQLKEISDLCRVAGSPAVELLSGQAESELWWAVRDLPRRVTESASGSVGARCSVLISGLQKTAEAALRLGQTHGLTVALDGRAGNGVLNAWFLGQAGDEARQAAAVTELRAAAAGAGGTMVLDFAPLAVKQKVSVWGEPGSDFAAMKAVKEHLDPKGMLNPGRYVGGL